MSGFGYVMTAAVGLLGWALGGALWAAVAVILWLFYVAVFAEISKR